MARKLKHPNHTVDSNCQINKLMDTVVHLWELGENPSLSHIAAELEMSPAKVRKLLISAGMRDGITYYHSETATQILSLYQAHVPLLGIQKRTGLSIKSIQGYLPYSKTVYRLESKSAEAERIELFRQREAALEKLREHIGSEDASEYLWRAVIAFESYTFTTSGRGKDRIGAVSFRYSVKRSTGAGGRHYQGASVPGYGNELFIQGKEKSISRSTVDLALKNALDVQEKEGFVSGPRKLGIPGARSNLYSIFLRFGIICDSKTDDSGDRTDSIEGYARSVEDEG